MSFRSLHLSTPVSLAVAAALSLAASSSALAGAPKNVIPASVQSVEFIGMAAPDTVEERAMVYTEAAVKVTYRNGKTQMFPLSFHELHNTLTTINGVTAGDLYDQYGNVLLDPALQPQRSEAPDANSLLDVPGAKSDDPSKRRLFLVTHHEYDWIDTLGNDNYGKQPMTMNLASIDQDKKTGEMKTVGLKNIDFSGIRGLWIPCAGSLSPWNTHLGSQEYEPDARCAENPGAFCASMPNSATADPNDLLTFNDPANFLNLDSMNRYLDPSGVTKPARVYDYGIVPEVTVDRFGNATVEAHRALGRISRELVQVMPDQRTVYQGDDGTYNVMTMFVADSPADLSAGTLYAAKWNQTSALNGGAADLDWIRLGHASDAQLTAMVDGGIKFSDIWEVGSATNKATCESVPGFKFIKAGHNVGLTECLKPKTGMLTAAAFLETRRYAAYVGATVEFEKFEGVTVNAAGKKVYVAMTRMRSGMQDVPADPANDIKLPRNDAGAVYEIDLEGGQSDTGGGNIASDYVGVAMRALVVGETIPADPAGNTANVDKIASPDNVKYSEKMRTLFIGEDSGLHVNNFLWAYNVDSKKLSRILSIPAGAESTGLQVLDDMNGSAYIMSNYQHAGDFTSTTSAALKTALTPLIDKYKAGIGYIGGLPALK
ncbi:MAG: alkaline phosphatase PhoX [Steroidobacteraceae bacterium]